MNLTGKIKEYEIASSDIKATCMHNKSSTGTFIAYRFLKYEKEVKTK